MPHIDRRQALTLMAGSATAALLPPVSANDPLRPRGTTCTLGFGAYGLPGKTTEEALRMIAEAGYDSAELTITADRDSAPEAMSKERRAEIRTLLGDLNLRLTSLMEHVTPIGNVDQQAVVLDRLRRAAELAHDLSPDRPPVIQTVLGGNEWSDVRSIFVARLPAWLALAEASRTVICIKPHRGNAMSRPEQCVALLKELGDSRWLRMCYDYSHFAFREMRLVDTITTSLPFTKHIAVKDVAMENNRAVFGLPGDKRTIDYADLLRPVNARGYRGDVCVEVSSLLWRKPDYDMQAALKSSYDYLATAFQDAEVPRP